LTLNVLQAFNINEEFMAMLTSISAHVDQFRGQHDWYIQRVAIYRHFDGTDNKRSWRIDLIKCLSDWLARFPNSGKLSNRSSTGAAYAPSHEDEVAQVARTLPPGLL
jgi:hypothetical protein